MCEKSDAHERRKQLDVERARQRLVDVIVSEEVEFNIRVFEQRHGFLDLIVEFFFQADHAEQIEFLLDGQEQSFEAFFFDDHVIVQVIVARDECASLAF